MKNRLLTWMALTALLLAIVLVAGSPAGVSAQGTGQISGTVTNIIGSPLENIEVWLYRQIEGEWTYSTYTTTNTSGEYALTNLTAENYRLHFRDWSQTYAYEYYDDGSRLAQAIDIPVGEGEVVTINEEMELAGRIKGTITGPAGQALDYGYVFVHEYESDTPGQPLFVVQPTGINYEFGGLPTGNYKVHFSGQVSGQYFNEYYQDKYDFALADPVAVETGFTTENINGVIGEPVNAAISGVVRNSGGTSLSGIEVSLYQYSTISGWRLIEYLDTNASGAYSFPDLLPGLYRLYFKDWNQLYAFEYYDNALTLGEATDIQVNPDEQVTIPDVILEEGGRISGSLTAPDGSLLQNALVFIHRHGPEYGSVLYMQSVTNGTYNIGGLPTGNYRVQFSGWQGSNSYVEYYDDQTDWEQADPVPVTVGQTTNNINAVLGELPGGSISGELTDIYGRSFDESRVKAFVNYGGNWELFKTETLDYYTSDYEISLPPGTYRLEFEGESFLNPGNPTREVYNDVQTLGEGEDITVTLGETVRGIDAQLGNFATGSISGRVFNESGAPLSSIEVYVYNRSLGLLWDQIAVTDANGDYTVSGLWPEAYYVEFYDPALGFIHEFYNGAASPPDAERVLVTYDAVTGIDAALAEADPGTMPGNISGTVTDENSNPLFGVSVTAFDLASGDFVGAARTASDGTYRLRNIPEISVTLRFADANKFYLTEWYDNAGSEEEADPVAVPLGTSISGIDAALTLGGKISGTVTDPDGNPFPILSVNAYEFDDALGQWVQVANDAGLYLTEYELGPLPAGEYRIGFSANFFPGNGYTEFYDDVSTIEAGTDVPVVAGEITGGIDAELGPDLTGEISGTVTDGSGNPLSNINVRAVEFDFGFVAEETTTAADGTYVLADLFNGIYFVEFADPTGTYPGEWYEDVPTATWATPITVSDAPVTGIDAALNGANGGPGGGSITGRVTLETTGDPLPGIEVRCYDDNFSPVSACETFTDANGEFFLGGFLPTGDYLVRFDSPDGTTATEYYDDVRRFDEATPISVTQGLSTPGIDAALTPAGFISGTLSGPDGNPLEIQSVVAFTFNGVEWEYVAGETWIYPDEPAYILGGLPEGTYRIRFSGGTIFNSDQFIEYYDDVELIADGTDVPVVAGQVTPDINAVLGDIYDGGISGRVTDINGIGLDLVNVIAYRDDGFEYRSTSTDADGNYTFDLLPEGTYYLGIFDSRGLYATEYYDDQPTLDTATPINVTNSVISGIDAALSEKGSIVGRVTDLNGDPLDFVQVTAYTLVDSDWVTVTGGFADPAGNYVLDDLLPDTYRVTFMGYRLVPGGPPEMFVEVYDDQPTLPEGTDIVLGDGALVTGIDAQLGNIVPEGSIYGTVMNTAGQGLPDMRVTVFIENPNGLWVPLGEVMTDATGEFEFTNMADHHYRLCFTDPAGNYDGECYNDVTDMTLATNVVVHNGQPAGALEAWLSGEGDPPPPPPADPEHQLFIPVIMQTIN